jgi:hypothetical protein
MEQNNLEKSAGFLSEIGIVLRRDGYDSYRRHAVVCCVAIKTQRR